MLPAYDIHIPKTEVKQSVSDGYNFLTGFKDYLSIFPFHSSAQS